MCWCAVHLCQFMRREGEAGAWGTRVLFCLNSARQFGCVVTVVVPQDIHASWCTLIAATTTHVQISTSVCGRDSNHRLPARQRRLEPVLQCCRHGVFARGRQFGVPVSGIRRDQEAHGGGTSMWSEPAFHTCGTSMYRCLRIGACSVWFWAVCQTEND